MTMLFHRVHFCSSMEGLFLAVNSTYIVSMLSFHVSIDLALTGLAFLAALLQLSCLMLLQHPGNQSAKQRSGPLHSWEYETLQPLQHPRRKFKVTFIDGIIPYTMKMFATISFLGGISH